MNPVHAGSSLSSRTTASTSSRVDPAGRSRRIEWMPISAQSRCLAPTYHWLPGSSPTSTVPRPGTTPRSASAATRARSSSLMVARIALPSRVVAVTAAILPPAASRDGRHGPTAVDPVGRPLCRAAPPGVPGVVPWPPGTESRFGAAARAGLVAAAERARRHPTTTLE